MHFVNNLMHEFTTTQTNEDNEFIIPPCLFEGQKLSYLIALVIDFYEDLEDYETTKKRKVLIVLDDMVGNMETIKRLSPIFTEISLRGGTFIISLVFISQSYFEVLNPHMHEMGPQGPPKHYIF